MQRNDFIKALLGSASLIAMDGFSQTTGALKAGDYIKFANHDKVYMVVEDQSDISTGTLTIEPPLRSAVSATDIVYDNVPFTVRLRNDIQEFSIGTTNLYQYELDVIESL